MGTPEWFYIVATTGLITMVMAAKIALFKDDLKALLAYSTVSHLGLITMLLGFGTKAAAVVAVFHIISHATFKAALFMSAGIIDHEANTRDIKRLGGLRHLMPITFTIVCIAALSMAGIPPLNGFLSKEMMLEEAAHTIWLGNGWFMPVLATIGAMFSVAYSFRLVAHVFLGPVREDYPTKPHDPGFGMWAAPALLAVLVVVFGVMPMTTLGDLVRTTASAVIGGAADVNILHWHGFTAALWMSMIAVGAGLILLGLHRPFDKIWLAAPRPDAKAIFDGMMEPFAGASRAITDRLHDGSFARYAAIATLAIMAAGYYAYDTGSHAAGTRSLTPIEPVPFIGWVLLMGATGSLFTFHRNRLLALVLVGVIGLMVSVGFVYLSAPDLALTQISVEVATVMLLLLALNFLPKHSPVESSVARRGRDGLIAAAAGIGIGTLIYGLMMRDSAFQTIADYHLANAKPGGGGTNVVNVILVDFRGYDTFGEITVLGIAGLVIYALVEALLRGGPANDRLLAWVPDKNRAGDRHPLMLVVATRMILPVAIMVGAYIFLRGHNEPGGGFIAGLVVAIATIMQYMASGYGWAAARQRIDYHALIGSGVTIAGLCGVGSWFVGRPFLTSAFGYVHPPFVEKFELATAAIFDLGVFLTVVGAVMLALASISRIALRAGGTVNVEPFDVKPSDAGAH